MMCHVFACKLQWHLGSGLGQLEELTGRWFQDASSINGGFLKWWYPKMDGFLMENPAKMDDLGVSLFQESSICSTPG